MQVCARRYRFASLVVLLGTLALLLAGCDIGPNPSDMAKDQTLKMLWAQNSFSGLFAVDPVLVQDSNGLQVASLLFDGLVTLDRNGHIEPWSAESWTISPDGLTYTFKLRPNQRFSDGAPVKASDFAWSIDRAANSCAGSSVAFDLVALKDDDRFTGSNCTDAQLHTTLVGDALLPDDSAKTLKILLRQPSGYFLNVLASPAGFVLERRVIGRPDRLGNTSFLSTLAHGATGQGGSGMFYLAKGYPSAFNNPGTLVLRPNPNWWGIQMGKKPHFSEIDMSVPHSNYAINTFNDDSTQAFASTFPPDKPVTQYEQQSYYHEQPILAYRGIIFHWNNAPFDDINARKAFCLAINREQFNQQLYAGLELPSWHIVPEGMDGYDAQLQGPDGAPVAGDTALAQRFWQLYLDAHNNQIPSIAINYSLNGDIKYLEASTWLMNVWNQTLGIHTVVDRSEWGHGPGWQNSRQVVGFTSRADYADPQFFLATFMELNGNYDGAPKIDVPAADALLRQGDALSEMSQRIPLYQQAEQLLIDNVAVCPLYQLVNHYALRPWVKGGFAEDARGIFPNDAWVSGYIAKH